MRISHRHRLIYFSIPKTGSESVRALLDGYSDVSVGAYSITTPETPFYSHMRPVEARAALAAQGRAFDGYFRFATVRNPWARIASLYMMGRRNTHPQVPASLSAWLDTLEPSRADGAGRKAKWYHHGVMSMTRFLSDDDGRPLVDKTYRIEDQLADLCRDLTDVLGETVGVHCIPHVNRSPKRYDWRTLFKREKDREKVAALYADDIERFGYTC